MHASKSNPWFVFALKKQSDGGPCSRECKKVISFASRHEYLLNQQKNVQDCHDALIRNSKYPWHRAIKDRINQVTLWQNLNGMFVCTVQYCNTCHSIHITNIVIHRRNRYCTRNENKCN